MSNYKGLLRFMLIDSKRNKHDSLSKLEIYGLT